MPRLLTDEEIDRQLAELPEVYVGPIGSLTVALQAPTFPDAVRLVEEVAAHAEQMDHHPDIDLRWRTVTFTLSTHSAGGVTQLDIELAHQILAAGRTFGARPLPVQQRLEIVLDCVDLDAVRRFWVTALGWREQPTPSGGTELHDPAGRAPVLWFQPMDPPRPGRGRFHLDVYLPADEVPDRLKACLDAGGALVSEAYAPSWWVLTDPEGNEVCLCSTPDPGHPDARS